MKIRNYIIIFITLLLLISCKIVNRKEYNSKKLNDRKVNIDLILTILTDYVYNYDNDNINKILDIEINRSDLLLIYISESSFFWSGRIKINDKIIKLTDQNYLKYISFYNIDKYQKIEKEIIYEDVSIGNLYFVFNK